MPFRSTARTFGIAPSHDTDYSRNLIITLVHVHIRIVFNGTLSAFQAITHKVEAL